MLDSDHIGGYRPSSVAQRKLQYVTRERCFLPADSAWWWVVHSRIGDVIPIIQLCSFRAIADALKDGVRSDRVVA